MRRLVVLLVVLVAVGCATRKVESVEVERLRQAEVAVAALVEDAFGTGMIEESSISVFQDDAGACAWGNCPDGVECAVGALEVSMAGTFKHEPAMASLERAALGLGGEAKNLRSSLDNWYLTLDLPIGDGRDDYRVGAVWEEGHISFQSLSTCFILGR